MDMATFKKLRTEAVLVRPREGRGPGEGRGLWMGGAMEKGGSPEWPPLEPARSKVWRGQAGS